MWLLDIETYPKISSAQAFSHLSGAPAFDCIFKLRHEARLERKDDGVHTSSPLRLLRIGGILTSRLTRSFGRSSISPVALFITQPRLMPRPAIILDVSAAIVLVAVLTASAANRGSDHESGRAASTVAATGTGATSGGVEASVSTRRHVLVLLRTDAVVSQLERVQKEYTVISLLRPRILVLDVDDEMATQLRRDSEIVGVYEGQVPAEIVGQLDAGEKLFVNAWSQQQSSEGKKRTGDGLPWDSPGFVPPDRPPGSKTR